MCLCFLSRGEYFPYKATTTTTTKCMQHTHARTQTRSKTKRFLQVFFSLQIHSRFFHPHHHFSFNYKEQRRRKQTTATTKQNMQVVCEYVNERCNRTSNIIISSSSNIERVFVFVCVCLSASIVHFCNLQNKISNIHGEKKSTRRK